MNTFFKGKKLKPATRGTIKGFLLGSIITSCILTTIGTKKFYDLKNHYDMRINTDTNINSSTENLLYQELQKELQVTKTISEVCISDIEKNASDTSNLASTTIKIANNKNKNILISDSISRAEVREDGNLVKIINVEDDIIQPHSIETLSINFPLSPNTQELSIEVFSPLITEPISSKTFNLSTNES